MKETIEQLESLRSHCENMAEAESKGEFGSPDNIWAKDVEAINAAIEIIERSEWIPCSERLPERDENVLTYHRNESFDYQYVSWIDDYSGKWAGFIGNLSDEVLAWMPLPEEYKDEEGSKE